MHETHGKYGLKYPEPETVYTYRTKQRVKKAAKELAKRSRNLRKLHG